MPFLITAVVLVGLLCVLDLILTFGVMRRLREHTTLLSARSSAAPDIVIPAGATIGSFAATTVAGVPVAGADIEEGTLVGFFAPGCSTCEVELPRFVEVAGAHPGGARKVLAVVLGEGSTAPYVDALSPVAGVVLAPFGHEIETAFQVRGYPGYALVGRERVVRAAGSLAIVAPSVVAV